ncbi:hypothetical protein AQUCO_06400028v1 [Aquilegia coerulea]|uniref:Uncharacterized protein n=1 Tax=Aquilegia coerulea TaxID=218851 RepID=A0A2G5CCI2_AQUCA|nr:hypothetical protein AQUCO_06400028v1 [Aquilegia coerulea]
MYIVNSPNTGFLNEMVLLWCCTSISKYVERGHNSDMGRAQASQPVWGEKDRPTTPMEWAHSSENFLYSDYILYPLVSIRKIL